ncbi:DUF6777 domain-containing protein [Streptomyces clavuligerus]|nr:DUF6777 domain-containing protein [Streptomyces clavuligerus]ANW21509.1 hypothetical protein BB341_26505 [Streptomyces clavuligerus]AXU16142.1 hypothetical protein D1794_27550 [Streptomyces clavuligerus]MBY6306285.1 hypothetical protein [Streptomyces clavuligerus]QCS08921.1 hypothetical protein CRV15_26915 [Streptomyces clavuligerus]QPJ91743.1 hypothetical protein GE265_01240 [Streptomyces clavuligerus]
MSAEPPPSEHPTGPPSGPLSDGTRDGSIPPPPPPSGGGPGGGAAAPEPEPGGGVPWWRSAPRVAALAAAVVVAVVLVVVLTRPGGSGTRQELLLEAAGSPGPRPFTATTARPGGGQPTGAPSTAPQDTGTTQGVSGATQGLYGGTVQVSSCDVERQISYLAADPPKNRAFASAAGIGPGAVPDRLRSLTPVQLRLDTRVTNHGYENGGATAYQAVLQAGTAVLVDDRGVPRVRCACGNPLTPPEAQKGGTKVTGDSWPAYNPARVVFVEPAPVTQFVLFDAENDRWFARPAGDDGTTDRPVPPPSRQAVVACPAPYPAGSVCPSGVPTPSVAPPPKSASPESPGTPAGTPPPASPPGTAPAYAPGDGTTGPPAPAG